MENSAFDWIYLNITNFHYKFTNKTAKYHHKNIVQHYIMSAGTHIRAAVYTIKAEKKY